MSGRCRCFCVIVLAGCLGASWACRAENGADKKSSQAAQTKAKQFAGLEVLKRPPALKKDATISPEAAIRRALETRVRAEFFEAPLFEVCEIIEKQLGIPVLLDRRSLDDEGLAPDTPMSCAMNDVRLRSCLDLMLSDEELTWTIHCEVLLITTTVAAQEFLETRVYDVADLASASESGCNDYFSLSYLFTTIISQESWQDVGGEGYISDVGGQGIRAIAILQTLRNHDKIEKLMAALRVHVPKKADENNKDADKDLSKISDTQNSVKSQRENVLSKEETICRALRKKVDLNFDETPIIEVVESLKKLLQIEIQLHKRSLADEGLDLETPISFRVSGISAASAMNLMLRDLDLTYVIVDDFLLILTTVVEEESYMDVKVYDVSDLIGKYTQYSCSDALIPAITSTISSTCWDIVGGAGSIVPFENSGMRVLVVNQTQRVQGEIKKFLADLRKVQRQIDDMQPATDRMGPKSGMQGKRGSRSRKKRCKEILGPFFTPMRGIETGMSKQIVKP